MNEQLHIIITGESGKTLRFPLARKKVITYSTLAAILFVSLAVTSVFSVSLFTRNTFISGKLSRLQEKVDKSDAIIARLEKDAEAEQLRLKEELALLKKEKDEQIAYFEEEKKLLLSTAVSELNERSGMIESIIDNIGVKVAKSKPEKNSNSGGPFIEKDPGLHDELLYKADAYLKTIQSIPLGKPVHGSISSRFGPRIDPLNNRKGFHEGIDFRGRIGDEIYATADGIVKKAFKNGGYGNFVMIDHQNGYTTSFAHMKKFFVKKGEQVRRGQLIGQVGNTGRSTGPHLHYEMLYKGKPVNPMKYMKIANLTVPKKTVKLLKSTSPGKIIKE